MKALFVFKVFVLLSTNALATVCEDRFISAKFVVNNVFVYDQAVVHVIVSFAIFRHDHSKSHFASLCLFPKGGHKFQMTRSVSIGILDLTHVGTEKPLCSRNTLGLTLAAGGHLSEVAPLGLIKKSSLGRGRCPSCLLLYHYFEHLHLFLLISECFMYNTQK